MIKFIRSIPKKINNWYKIQRLKDLIVYHEECYRMINPFDSQGKTLRKLHKIAIVKIEGKIEILKNIKTNESRKT